MTTVLGIDTATLTASVAIARGDASGARILASFESDVNSHSQALLALVDRALSVSDIQLSDLDGIAVGAGPGSFTGLRIGMATAKGLAFATDRPLWAVSSLAALAMHVWEHPSVGRDTLVVPILDARRMEIFAGFYRLHESRAHLVSDEIVIAPGELAERVAAIVAESRAPGPVANIVALGDGLDVYGDELIAPLVSALGERITFPARIAATPSAEGVARLALADDPPDILVAGAPSYVRLSEAEIKYPNGNPGPRLVRADQDAKP